MKPIRILLTITLLGISLFASAQGEQSIGNKKNTVFVPGGLRVDSIFIVPVRDTVASLWSPTATQRLQGRFTVRPQDSLLYYNNGRRWRAVGSGVAGGSGSGTGEYDAEIVGLLGSINNHLVNFARDTSDPLHERLIVEQDNNGLWRGSIGLFLGCDTCGSGGLAYFPGPGLGIGQNNVFYVDTNKIASNIRLRDTAAVLRALIAAMEGTAAGVFHAPSYTDPGYEEFDGGNVDVWMDNLYGIGFSGSNATPGSFSIDDFMGLNTIVDNYINLQVTAPAGHSQIQMSTGTLAVRADGITIGNANKNTDVFIGMQNTNPGNQAVDNIYIMSDSLFLKRMRRDAKPAGTDSLLTTIVTAEGDLVVKVPAPSGNNMANSNLSFNADHYHNANDHEMYIENMSGLGFMGTPTSGSANFDGFQHFNISGRSGVNLSAGTSNPQISDLTLSNGSALLRGNEESSIGSSYPGANVLIGLKDIYIAAGMPEIDNVEIMADTLVLKYLKRGSTPTDSMLTTVSTPKGDMVIKVPAPSGGGSTPSLQDVTNVGAITEDAVTFADPSLANETYVSSAGIVLTDETGADRLSLAVGASGFTQLPVTRFINGLVGSSNYANLGYHSTGVINDTLAYSGKLITEWMVDTAKTNIRAEIAAIGGGGSSQWVTTGSDIYYNTGNVGIGLTSPHAFYKLNLRGTTYAMRTELQGARAPLGGHIDANDFLFVSNSTTSGATFLNYNTAAGSKVSLLFATDTFANGNFLPTAGLKFHTDTRQLEFVGGSAIVGFDGLRFSTLAAENIGFYDAYHAKNFLTLDAYQERALFSSPIYTDQTIGLKMINAGDNEIHFTPSGGTYIKSYLSAGGGGLGFGVGAASMFLGNNFFNISNGGHGSIMDWDYSTGLWRFSSHNPSVATFAFGVPTATAPAASAVMQVDATSNPRGFLPPRMTTAQRTGIASPAEGLIVYDTDTHKSYTFDGTVWQAHW